MSKLPLTKEVRSLISQMAQSLPPVKTGKLVPMYKRMYGSQIISEMNKRGKKGPYTIKVNGKDKEVNASKAYNILTSDEELYNHTSELGKAWTQGGHPACLQYIFQMKQLAANQTKKDSKKLELEIGEVREDIQFTTKGTVDIL